MTDPLSERDRAGEALGLVAAAAGPYLDSLDELPAYEPATEALLASLGGPLPETGDGSVHAVRELLDVGTRAAVHSTGPRCFQLVVGGSTPAAQAADWVTSLLDQVTGMWVASPLGASVEAVALAWLKDLFGLPASHGGVLTPSATFANLTGLACARHRWAAHHGVDVAADGLAGLPRMPVFSSGYVHASSRKALQILGCGRDSVRVLARDDAGRLDLAALERELAALDGAPAVLIGNAGDVNTGDFDPIAEMADLAAAYGAWLHVDGAFGLFAAVSPRTAHLVEGVDRAHSVAADGHKWLNVPYESGFVFVRDADIMGRAFGAWGGAPYLPTPDDPHPQFVFLGPESSRRARSLPIWATLRAYGREGHRSMVERHLDLAAHLGRIVDEDPDMELLAPVRLNIVCFRYRPAGRDDIGDAALDTLNRRIGEELAADGRVLAGTTTYRGMTALRPAIVNWRTTRSDIDLLATVVREIGGKLVEGPWTP